ncbi:MAG TPA: DUF4351 domain-containing protein [Thermoanaerobaculia bacterium]|nr:DUF4351 domain-containing protein [Thermoanaerobaculia bacterium]
MTSHDRLFKNLFRAFFLDLLALADGELAAGLSRKGIEFLEKELSLVPEGKRREVDLLAAIPDQAGETRLLVHLEIEKQARSTIGRRLWRYSLQLHLRHREPLVSLVVFLHGGPSGPVWAVHIEEARGRETTRFSYLSFGLSRMPAEDLLARPEPLAWGLAALARPGALGRVGLKLELLRRIAGAKIGEVERLLLVNCVETYLQLTGREATEFDALRTRDSLEVEEMELTWADQIEAKGVAKGIERGVEKGVDRLRQTVLRQLDQRFGQVSPALRRRVEAIRSLDELGAIADRIFEVQVLEELGLAD